MAKRYHWRGAANSLRFAVAGRLERDPETPDDRHQVGGDRSRAALGVDGSRGPASPR